MKKRVFVVKKRLWKDEDLIGFESGDVLVVKNTTPDIQIILSTRFYDIVKGIKNRQYKGSYLGETIFNRIYEEKTGHNLKHRLD